MLERYRPRVGNKEALLAAAQECVLDKGYDRTTVRDITQRAGVSMAAIGYHFGSREALIDAALTAAVQEWGAHLERTCADGRADRPEERFTRLWARLLDPGTVDRSRWLGTHEMFLQGARSPALRAAFADVLEAARAGQAATVAGGPPSDRSVRSVGAVHLALVSGLLMQQITDPERAPGAAAVADGLRSLAAAVEGPVEGAGGAAEAPIGAATGEGGGTAHRAVDPAAPHWKRVAELLWAGRRRGSRGRKPSLTLDRIVRAAVDLADAEGISALSLPRLSAELGYGAMSLYRYVPGKDALVCLAVDAAIGPPEAVPAGEGWRRGLERWARGHLAVFERHPWVLAHVTTPRVLGPHEIAHLEAALAVLADAGLDHEAQLRSVLLVNNYVRGAAHTVVDAGVSAHGRPPSVRETVERFGREDVHPRLLAVLRGGGAPSGSTRAVFEATFEYGLQRVLDGVAAAVQEASN